MNLFAKLIKIMFTFKNHVCLGRLLNILKRTSTKLQERIRIFFFEIHTLRVHIKIILHSKIIRRVYNEKYLHLKSIFIFSFSSRPTRRALLHSSDFCQRPTSTLVIPIIPISVASRVFIFSAVCNTSFPIALRSLATLARL